MRDEGSGSVLFSFVAYLLTIVTVVAVFIGLGFLGLWINRQTQPYAAETQYLTQQQSQAFIDGTMTDFDNLCLAMDTAAPAQQGIYADTIRRRAARVKDDVLDRLQPVQRNCIRRARDMVAGAIRERATVTATAEGTK
jgi:hypothetical protein